ncbi:TAXI family TRAP transporter solute-binding subunit [Marinomonas sp. C2222]|uniref:TAXI family TRAP transporter solute-binding subunit n=1 Tax=Marinomonas sargassi TaxID=2984494 RepID=A0ABT2YUR1_9GAMM|nr:TAXI family TRAP transporter solute-binding subunit [Marinomonas sargassi]MCV2403637.1 TAXI family TRAP transporter solute-binding subunit [Marinomonas sargassi]
MNSFIKTTAVWLIAILTANSYAEELKLGTAREGGSYFSMGNTIAELVEKYSREDTSILTVTTAGSEQNLHLLSSENIDLALTNTDLATLAIAGKGPYRGHQVDVQAIATLHPSVLHIVVLKDSKIHTINDFKGKKVAVGPSGGGTLDLLNFLFSLHDISLRYMSPRYLSYASGLSQLKDGWVDIAFLSSGYPADAMPEKLEEQGMRLIPLTQETFTKMQEKQHPAYKVMTIPKNVYQTSSDIPTIGINNVLVTTEETSPEAVEDILHSIFDHFYEFTQRNKHAAQISLKESLELTMPLHEGAKQYFDKLGIKAE